MEVLSFAPITKLKSTMLDGGGPQDTGASANYIQAKEEAARLFLPQKWKDWLRLEYEKPDNLVQISRR